MKKITIIITVFFSMVGMLMAADEEQVNLYIGEKTEGLPLGFVPVRYDRSRNDIVSVIPDLEHRQVSFSGMEKGTCTVVIYGENNARKIFQIKVNNDLRPLKRQLDAHLDELGGTIEASIEGEKIVIEGTMRNRSKWQRYQNFLGEFKEHRREISSQVKLECTGEVLEALRKAIEKSSFKLVEQEKFDQNLQALVQARTNDRYQKLRQLINTGCIYLERNQGRTDIYLRGYVSTNELRKSILESWKQELRLIPDEAAISCHDDIQVHTVDPDSLIAELSWQLKDSKEGLEVSDKPVVDKDNVLWIERRDMEFGSIATVKGVVKHVKQNQAVASLVEGMNSRLKELGNVGRLQFRNEVKLHIETLDVSQEVLEALRKTIDKSNFKILDKEVFVSHLRALEQARTNDRYQKLRQLLNTGCLYIERNHGRSDIYLRGYVASDNLRKAILGRWEEEVKQIPKEATISCHDDIQVHVVDPDSLIAELVWQLKDSKEGLEVSDKPVKDKTNVLWIERRDMEFGSIATVKGVVNNDKQNQAISSLVEAMNGKSKALFDVAGLQFRTEVKARVEMLDISMVYVALTEGELKEFGNPKANGTLIPDFSFSALYNSLKGKDSELGQTRSWKHSAQASGGIGIDGAVRFFKSNGVDRMREAAHLRFRSDSEVTYHQGGKIIMQLQGDNPTVKEVDYGINLAATVEFTGNDNLTMKLKYTYSNQPSGGQNLEMTDTMEYNTSFDLTLNKTLITVGQESQKISITDPSGLAVARKIPVLNWLTAQESKEKTRMHLFLLIHPRILTDEVSGETIDVQPLDQRIYYETDDPDKKKQSKSAWEHLKFW